jgi:hypothetical protein
MLLFICLCLPCALVVMSYIAPRPTVEPDVFRERIHELPTHIVTRAEAQGQDASCVICPEDYEEGTVLSILPCRHEMHSVCADKWLPGTQTCPFCRASIIVPNAQV